MAASRQLLRAALGRSLLTLHRCFISASYLRLSNNINENGTKSSHDQAVEEKTEEVVEAVEAEAPSIPQDVIEEKVIETEAPSSHEDVVREPEAKGIPNQPEEETSADIAEEAVEESTPSADEHVEPEAMTTEEGDNTVSQAKEEVVSTDATDAPKKTEKKLQKEGITEGDIFLQSTLEDQEHSSESDSDQSGYSSDEFYDTEDEVRLKILDAALNHVSIYGWSSDAIAAGAEDVGLSSVAEGMFERAGGDLVLHFIENCNIDLAEHLSSVSRLKEREETGEEPKTKTRDFLRDALKTRLEMVGPHVKLGTWTQAMGLMLLPQNAPNALENAANMVDEIWYHAGDTSTDVDWYMKRGVLAALYGATELYMLRDRSEGFRDTWTFLDRRVNDAHNAAQAKAKVEQCASDAAQMTSVAFSMARNVLGLNNRTR